MIDFESAFMTAFTSCFSDANMSACFFHFTQSLWRNVQSGGLQKLYNNNVRFALNIKMLMTLAFVPVQDVCDEFTELIQSTYFDNYEDELELFVNYFVKTWVGVLSHSGKRRLKPYFPIKLWNCYDAVINEEMRSNNGIEGWHSSFNAKVRVSHASMSRFINVIKDKQMITELFITQLNTGMNVMPKRRKMYAKFDSRLKKIVDQ